MRSAAPRRMPTRTAAEAVRELGPWFHNLHLADGTQTAPDHVLGDFPSALWAALAPEFDMEAERFELEMLSADARNETFRDFLTSQQAGVQGFPLLAAGTETGGYALVTNGFRPLDGLPEAIESWLEAGAPVQHGKEPE